jgi:hypothetical protein
MENYHLDRKRASVSELLKLRRHVQNQIGGRDCIVIGSAPTPVVPAMSDPFVLCVNGSVFSANEYWGRNPDLTYLCGAIFNEADAYATRTKDTLRGRSIGDVLIARHAFKKALPMLADEGISHGNSFPLSKYDKRIILGESIGYFLLGGYRCNSNVSNGLFMVGMALWGGASRVVFSGISFGNQHAYSAGTSLSQRGHLHEDQRFLEVTVERNLPVFTTSDEIHARFGVRMWSDPER